MPMSPPSVCGRCGCTGTVRDGVCTHCGPRRRQWNRSHDQARGNSNSRGYDRRWRDFAIAYLQRNPLCVDCDAEGIVGAATEVHHVRKLRDYPDGKYEQSNLMPLCSDHHRKRTAKGE